MANYSQLKAAIADVIKTNGTQAITGQVLQDVLNSMVSVIGANYTFAGVATPSTNPSTPDQNVVYFASQAGTYTNFNNIVLPDGISLLLWNGSWSYQTFFAVDEKPQTNSGNFVKSGGVYEELNTIYSVSSEHDTYYAYIRNIYLVPETQEKLNYLKGITSPTKILVAYLGVRNSNLGGSTSIFGLQMRISASNHLTKYINYVPKLYDNSIVELNVRSGGAGELGSGFRVFVEFNENINFGTASGLISLNNTWLKPLNNTTESLFKSILSNYEKNSTIVGGSEKEKVFPYIKNVYIIPQTQAKLGYLKENNTYITYLGVRNSNLGGSSSIFGLQIRDVPESSVPTNSATFYIDYVPTFYKNNIVELNKISNSRGEFVSGFRVFVEFNDNIDFSTASGLIIVSNNVFVDSINKMSVSFASAISSLINKTSYIVVDKQGNGDYPSVTEAANNAADGAIIIVKAGVYDNETVRGADKTLFIIGVDKEKCIIKNNNGDYYYPPIELASGCIKNLTVIAEATEQASVGHGQYAVHSDFHSLYNSSMVIDNCILQSNVIDSAAVGIGLRGGCNYVIQNSRLIAGYDSAQQGRALYVHDNNYSGGYDGKQVFRMIDCIVEAVKSTNIAVQIQGQGNVERDFTVSQFYIEFVRNKVKGTVSFINWYQNREPGLGTITPDDYQGIKNLRLIDTSWDNSDDVLNYE